MYAPDVKEIESEFLKGIEGIKSRLAEMVREDYPKGFIFKRKQHSVPFNLPMSKNFPFKYEFQKGEPKVFFNPNPICHSDSMTICVPFTVEQVGENSFIARD